MTMIPLSAFVSVSAASMIKASELANDSKACGAEAKRIYGRSGLGRGMWRNVQKKARSAIADANRLGMTLERPYAVIDGTVWCMSHVQGSCYPAY